MICSFCKKEFKTNSSLHNHQKNAKYCLKLRNKTNESLRCDGCEKLFGSKQWLNMHKLKCVNLIEKKLSKMETLDTENKYLKMKNTVLSDQLQSHWKFLLGRGRFFLFSLLLLTLEVFSRRKGARVRQLEVFKFVFGGRVLHCNH